MTRNKVLSTACNQCLKELYKYVYPRISWKNFIKECKEYSKKYKEWESLEDRPNIHEYCGPRPYEFYYLPKEIMNDICNSYISAYKIDNHKELLDTIETLKNYCKEPIIDKYIDGELREDGTRWPGHKGYEHPDNLLSQLTDLIPDSGFDKSLIAESVHNKFFEFLDMAGNFFNWNYEMNSFNTTVYLGPSPNSNKQTVIENWKKYRGKDIKINEKKMKENYYGTDFE